MQYHDAFVDTASFLYNTESVPETTIMIGKTYMTMISYLCKTDVNNKKAWSRIVPPDTGLRTLKLTD